MKRQQAKLYNKKFKNLNDGGRMEYMYICQQYSNLLDIAATTKTLWQRHVVYIYACSIVTSWTLHLCTVTTRAI